MKLNPSAYRNLLSPVWISGPIDLIDLIRM